MFVYGFPLNVFDHFFIEASKKTLSADDDEEEVLAEGKPAKNVSKVLRDKPPVFLHIQFRSTLVDQHLVFLFF